MEKFKLYKIDEMWKKWHDETYQSYPELFDNPRDLYKIYFINNINNIEN